MQSWNSAAFWFFPHALMHRKLLRPSEQVSSINEIDFKDLKKKGFQVVLFDKDNTLTQPYGRKLDARLKNGIKNARNSFGKSIAILSNHAGTPDDKGHALARLMERDLSIQVIRHAKKKPAGIEEIERQCKCKRNQMIVVGDRVLTDIAFGNRFGCYTILVDPLTTGYGNSLVKWVAGWERKLIPKS